MRLPTHFESATVVIFGGSFDPVTFTHVQLATEIINFNLAEQVWIVPCGMRPDKHTNVDPHRRLDLVSLAIDSVVPDGFPVYVHPIEVHEGRYVPTRELMCLFRERYPKLVFKVLIGNDLIGGIHLWDDFDDLVRENVFIVYNRIPTCSLHVDHFDVKEDFMTLGDDTKPRLKIERIIDVDMCPVVSNISSTEVRRRLLTKGVRSIVGLTPLSVVQFIEKNRLYPMCDS